MIIRLVIFKKQDSARNLDLLLSCLKNVDRGPVIAREYHHGHYSKTLDI